MKTKTLIVSALAVVTLGTGTVLGATGVLTGNSDEASSVQTVTEESIMSNTISQESIISSEPTIDESNVISSAPTETSYTETSVAESSNSVSSGYNLSNVSNYDSATGQKIVSEYYVGDQNVKIVGGFVPDSSQPVEQSRVE